MENIDADYLRNLSSKNKSYTSLLEDVLESAKIEAESGENSCYRYVDVYEYDTYDVGEVENELVRRGFNVHIDYNVEGDNTDYHVIRVYW